MEARDRFCHPLLACCVDLVAYAPVMACGHNFADKASPIRFSVRGRLWDL